MSDAPETPSGGRTPSPEDIQSLSVSLTTSPRILVKVSIRSNSIFTT